MILKSFGCSFIYGDELSDQVEEKLKASNPKNSRLTWPALLAKHHNIKHISYAKSGSGNLQIAESLLNQLATPIPSIYVISWTWIDRFDYINQQNNWDTIRPTLTDKNTTFYYKNLHSQYRDKLTSLISIKTVLDALRHGQHKFIMTAIDSLLWETDHHTNSTIEYLQKEIRPFITDFNGLGFLDWAKEQHLPISEHGGHPLDEAHRAAFELINAYNLV